MTVKEITLLSKEEYEKYKSAIPTINRRWWLRSPSISQRSAVGVHYDGDVSKVGYLVLNRNIAVRPALHLNLEIADNQFWCKPEKLIGTKLEYGKYTWTVLDASFGEIYALCDEFIADHRFDPESNDWDKSELKRWLKTEGLQAITLSPDLCDAIYTAF